MKNGSFFNKIALLSVLHLVFFSVNVFAGTAPLGQRFLSNNSLMSGEIAELSIDHSQLFASAGNVDTQQYQHYAMASGTGKTQGSSSAYQPSAPALETWHKYLGYGTILMAGVTAVSHSDEDFHESAAYATAASAISTVLTGYLAHHQRFDSHQGLLSKDNLHIVLGTLGAAILTTAVAIADDGEESSHSGLGVTGGVLMTLGVIDIKW